MMSKCSNLKWFHCKVLNILTSFLRSMRLQTMEIKIVDMSLTIDSFRFGDENDYKGRHLFKFSRLFTKIDTPESFILLFFFTTKVSSLISFEGGKALSRSLNDNRGGSRGSEGAGGAHPPPRDDQRFSKTTGILQKKLRGLLVLK